MIEEATELPPVLEDLSIHVIPGRVSDPKVGLEEVRLAERLGFKRVWLPERYSNKEAGVTLSAMAAATSRIGIGTGPFTLGSRLPLVTAAIGATLNSFYGPRFTLGVGRGDAAWAPAHGMPRLGYPEVIDYVRIVKQLWRGEVVHYDGPLGSFDGIKIDDLPDGPIPRTTMFHFGGPRASRTAADPAFDEVGFSPMLKPEVMYNSIQATRAEAERIGRDPDEIHFIAPVASAPELEEDEVRLLIAARIVIYLQVPELGATFVRMNGWDPKTRDEICNHPLFASMRSKLADNSFHRSDLLEVSRLVPESWIREVAVVGSLDECVKMMQAFKDTGCAEIDFYSSSPAQNAGLVEAWRNRSTR